MRHLLFLAVAACAAIAASAAVAGQYRGDGAYIGLPSDAVAGLFAQFPNGGQGLADAITVLLTNNPDCADDVAFIAAQSGNPDQLSAAGAGMVQAEAALRNANNGEAASRIARAARESGNPRLIAMAGTDSGVGVGVGGFAGGLFLPSNNASTSNSSQNCVTTAGNTMVSPATPPMTICH